MKRHSLAILVLPTLVACAQAEAPPREVAARSAMCDAFGFTPGTEAYAQCAAEAEKAQWREARSARARVNCTPMGDQTVCQ
jgi:hypothetical protein